MVRIPEASKRQTFILRADANARIGAGHLMRSLALAQGLRRAGHRATFLTKGNGLVPRLQAEGFDVEKISRDMPLDADARHTCQRSLEMGAAWVICDGYHFGETYQRILMGRKDLRLMCIDDIAEAHFVSDLVLNQNLGAREKDYSRTPSTRLLLGSAYTLLREEFLNTKAKNRQTSHSGPRILVTMGGSDPARQTEKAMRAMDALNDPGLHIRVVVGPNNPNADAIRFQAQQSKERIEVHEAVSDMARLMAWADLAVCAAGSTCWEMAYLGLPNIVLSLAENQKAIGRALDRQGCSVYLGWCGDVTRGRIAEAISELLADKDLRERMRQCGRGFIDGLGAKRVVCEMVGREVPVLQVEG